MSRRVCRLSLATITVFLWFCAQFADLPVPFAGTTLRISAVLAQSEQSV